MAMPHGHDQRTLPERLRGRGASRVLVQMARDGQLLELRCEMPTCYCPQGRKHFDEWPTPRHAPESAWAPNPDHYPQLSKDGGELRPWNVRLAHVRCNNIDYGWRTRIRAMLKKNPSMSFAEIAEALNRKKDRFVPPGNKEWTAARVRKAYVS